MRVLRKIVLGLLVFVLVLAVLVGGGAYLIFVRRTFPQTNGTLHLPKERRC